jgi:hypothetical protein
VLECHLFFAVRLAARERQDARRIVVCEVLHHLPTRRLIGRHRAQRHQWNQCKVTRIHAVERRKARAQQAHPGDGARHRFGARIYKRLRRWEERLDEFAE